MLKAEKAAATAAAPRYRLVKVIAAVRSEKLGEVGDDPVGAHIRRPHSDLLLAHMRPQRVHPL